MPSKSGLTINDVAEAAGVSVSTVSRVLNGKADVSAATREHIQRVIAQLGYSPDSHAQRLAGGKVFRIGMLYRELFLKHPILDPIYSEFMIAAATTAGELGLVLNFFAQELSDADLLHLYRSAQIDGLILMQVDVQDRRVELLQHHGYPFVMLGRVEGNDQLNFIELEFEQATRLAFDYLYGLGHRNIGFLGLEPQLETIGFGPAVRSWRANRKAIQDYGLAPLTQGIKPTGQAIYDATLRLLTTMPDLTAIVTPHCTNVHLILQALQAQGLRVPEDCSVIAIASSYVAEACVPALTTVHFPAHEMSAQAVRMLARLLENPETESEHHILDPEVIVRGSTAPMNRR